MSHVQITLVGGQAAPVYNGIACYNPDKVILVCSKQTQNEAMRIKAEFPDIAEIKVMDPVNIAEIVSETRALADSMPDDEIYVNISGGTKSWAFYFSRIFSERSNTKIFYIDQNNTIWNFTDQTHSQANFDLNLDVQFRLYGNSLKEYKLVSDFADDDLTIIPKIYKIRSFDKRNFGKLMNLYSENSENVFFDLDNGSYLRWDNEQQLFEINIRNRDGQSKHEILKSTHIRRLLRNYTWLELEIARVLSGWKFAKEVRLNGIFRDKHENAKNEIDCIVNLGNKILFVECKSHITNITDIDKFKNAVKVYGGSGCKALFTTIDPIRNDALEKCRDSNIIPFCIEKNGGINNYKSNLFEILEKEILNINP
ncbi:MAG: hypothetical protein PWQ53_725 [Bacteroidota bacterium]|jgi:Domain of unknown function (DUF1887).|nr:hypothetical protein [Bacteroidota bacterium]MDN5306066.1 hypothetical protein [Bacteroidota bacterium]